MKRVSMETKRKRAWGWATSLLASGALLFAAITPRSAQAQTFKVLYSFQGIPDGAGPSGLILYASGKLYGTTQAGGKTTPWHCSYYGCGTVFAVDTAGKETVLYRFNGARKDGDGPNAGLARDAAGTLYGTTVAGGAYEGGAIFKLDTSGKEVLLHSFGDGNDGSLIWSPVVRDKAGSLYGTTSAGGRPPYSFGIVFELDSSGYENLLYTFTGGADGGRPVARLIRDSQNSLYGVTSAGGNTQACSLGCGVVFKLDTTGKETVLYTFNNGSDGAEPNSIVRDATGNIYGTTAYGGTCGGGVAFKLDTKGRFKVLHCFAGDPKDGSGPGGLMRDARGQLYGTATTGGGGDCYDYYGDKIGCGVVFKLDKSGKERVLHRFKAGKDGTFPYGLAVDERGNFYGTTGSGGDTSCNAPYGCGTVYKLSVR